MKDKSICRVCGIETLYLNGCCGTVPIVCCEAGSRKQMHSRSRRSHK